MHVSQVVLALLFALDSQLCSAFLLQRLLCMPLSNLKLASQRLLSATSMMAATVRNLTNTIRLATITAKQQQHTTVYDCRFREVVY
jgi:hypothetical protein